jgi:subtilase family serine protease
LSFESLEVRTMLSADGLTSDLVEFSKAAAGSTGGGYTPAEIRTAYGFNNVSFGSTTANGAGQTIAIVDAYNDPNIASDLATFDAQFGIAAPASLKVVNQNGGTNLPGTDSTGGWEVEESLDVEWAHAIAPGANIVLVEASSDSDSSLFAAVNYAREQAGVSVISMSWGSDDSASDAANDQALAAQYLVTPSGHQGITFVAAAGDTGVAEFPSTSPDVLAVGGTDLYLNSNGTISKETYWTPQTIDGTTYSGGGGVSHEFAGRVVPDVSYDAGVGYDVYDSFTGGGGWISVGGTSAGSPQWAGLVAVADQGRVLDGQSTLNSATQTITALHTAPASDFNVITGGTTETTGLGSPDATLLIPYLTTYATTGGTTTTTTAPTAPASASATATSSSSMTVSWSTSTGATGYDLYELENGQDVLLGTYAAGTTSASVSGLAASTTYTFQVAAYNSAGTSATTSAQATTPAAAVVLTAPQNFRVTATSSSTATLSWQAVSGASGYQVYQWNGSSAVLINTLAAGSTSANVSGLAAGSTQYFYVSAYNATSSASTAWVDVVMPSASTATLIAPVLTATATSNTTGKLSWTASPGATGYEIYYMNGGQAVPLGAVGASTTSVTISGMAPGTTYEFLVQAYNRTSQANSQWTALTTTGSAATTRAAVADTVSNLTMVATADASVEIADPSAGLLPVGVTFNQAATANGSAGNSAGNSINSELAASVFSSTVAVDSLVRATLPGVGVGAGGSLNPTDRYHSASTGNTSGTAGQDDALGLNVAATVDIGFARQDYGLSRSWNSFAPSSAASEASSADHETTFFRRSLVDSLDTLFGRDIEWAGMSNGAASVSTGAAGGKSSTQAVAESTGAVSGAGESQRPSAALLAVGLALTALWSEGEEGDCVDPSPEPRQPRLKRRPVNP